MKKLGAIVLCCIFATAAEAGGIATRNYSASGLGVANAFVAGVEDVSAVAYNPSALAWQDGVQVMADNNIRYRNSSVDLGTGIGVAPNLAGTGNPSSAYLAWMPHDSNIGVALGFNRPYRAENNWNTAFPGLSGHTTISLNRASLDAVLRISSSLAVAAGGDWYLASANMQQGAQQFSGNGRSSYGGHLSLKWKPTPTWSLGMLARLGASVDITGSGNQSVNLKLPDEVTIGVAKDVYDSIRLELDADWSRWSKMKNLNVVNGGVITQANTLDLKDTLSIMAGATWYWRENTQFRFGYAYEQGANSSSGFNPIVADQSGHKIALGAGGDMFGVHGDVAYSYTFYPNKRAAGAFAGVYRDRRHAFSISLSKAF